MADLITSVAINKHEFEALWRLFEEFGDATTRLMVAEYRDAADVGWLRVTMKPVLGRGNHSRPVEPRVFKVSPLGHVYDWNSGVLLYERV